MNRSILAAMVSVALTVPVSANAALNLITFEEPVLTAMANSAGSAVPLGAQLSTQFLSTLGVSFDSGAGYVAVANHGFPDLTPTPPNVIGGTNAFGQLDYTAVIRASFYDPSNTANKATTDHVKVLGELFGLGSGTVTLRAFDQFGGLLGQVTDTDDKPLGFGPVLELNLAGIHYVTFSGTSGTVAYDNFEFNTVTPVSGAVPEPATWAMMIVGFGTAGSMIRRRKAVVA